MAKLFFTIAAGLLLASTAVQAGDFNSEEAPKHEISISYGSAPYTSIRDGFANIISSAIISGFTGELELQDKQTWGVINADYNYHVLPWLGLGANVSYSTIEGDIHHDSQTGKDTETYITVMANVKMDWYRREHITLYSRLSAGVMFENDDVSVGSKSESHNESCFMGQVSPIGLELGSQKLRFFTELGFGQAGLLQGGVRMRF